MTNLSCNACSCVHNDDNCCCLNGIDVKGSNACECSETCCGSYSYKDGSAKNNTASPKMCIRDRCKVVKMVRILILSVNSFTTLHL